MDIIHNERKKELLTFLLAKPSDQPRLFRNIIDKELKNKIKFLKDSQEDEQTKHYNKMIEDMIYESKVKGIEQQTKVLKEQIIAYKNGIKLPYLVSIIERKLNIVEMQLDVGVYNIMNNKNVKFYIDI